MKRFTTLMVMLLCFITSTWAQDVATTATPLESLQSGYYVLVMKTSDSRTDNTNGHFVYYSSEDLGVHYDEASATDNNLRGTTLGNDKFKYVFYVEKSDGKISIQAYGTKYYWPAIPAVIENKKEQHPANQSSFTVNTTASNFKYDSNGDNWYNLSTPAQKREWYLDWGVKWRTDNFDAFVTINDDTHKIGYWESGDKNKCQFQFYAIDDMPEPGSIAIITYNYIFEGKTRKTQNIGNVRIGRTYPDIDLAGLPDFITASKPEGNVAGDATIDIEVKENLPFQTSTSESPVYYYLENVKGTRLYANGSSLSYRAAEQAENINDIYKDLWYVTGNVFDGFQFHNVSANKIVYNASEMSHVSYLSFKNNGMPCANWDLFANGENFSLCAPAGTEYYEFGFVKSTYLNETNKKNYSWRLDDDNKGIGFKVFDESDDAFAFRLVEPTFTIPMYAVSGNTYNSFAAPFDVTLADADSNVKMYKGTVNEEGKELVLTQVDAAPANEGVVLIGENSSEDNVTLKAIAGAQALENNDLVGTTSAVTELSDKLIFGVSDQTGEVGFFSANSSVTSLAANHAYLSKPSTSIFMLSMRIDGQTTAIGSVSTDNKAQGNAAIYDLAGRKVSKTVKGQFYIQNGRKFIAQ